MNRITRRIATIAAVGTLAVSALTACGEAAQAVDCANLSQLIVDSSGTVGQDPATVKEQTDKLRDAAKDIDDAELKEAVNGYADSLDTYAELSQVPVTELTEDQLSQMESLGTEISTQANTITTKCSDLSS